MTSDTNSSMSSFRVSSKPSLGQLSHSQSDAKIRVQVEDVTAIAMGKG